VKLSLVLTKASTRDCSIQRHTKSSVSLYQRKRFKMTFSYSGDPATSDIDRLRFLIMDVDENKPLFSDEELQYLLDTYGTNEDMLEYQLFMQAATKFAYGIKRSLGPQSEDPTSRLNFFKARAEELKAKLQVKGLSLPKYQAPKQFFRGMQDNPPKPREPRFVR